MISKIIKLCGVNYIYESKVIQGPKWKYTTVSFFSFSVSGHTPPHWDLSVPTRDPTHTSYNEVWSLNHWTASQVPVKFL